MICRRCGTEYSDHLTECPRCTYGRVAVKKTLPRWAVGLLSCAGALVMIVTATVLFVMLHFNDHWMNGRWEGAAFSVTFNTDDGTCMFVDGEEIIPGTYKADKDSFTLITLEGIAYTYRYQKINNFEMNLFYERDGETLSLLVSRNGGEEEDSNTEEIPSDEPETPAPEPETPSDEKQNDTGNQPVEKPSAGQQAGGSTSEEKPTINRPTFEQGNDTPVAEDSSEMPILYINTNRKKEITSREEYIKAEVILSAAGQYSFDETSARIRGRGNSTWLHFDKKPYRLKFDEKVDLLGMGANKDWVLLANAFDETMMRSYLAFSLGKEFGLEYTTEFQFVHLYLNSEYRGVYLIAEQIEEGNSRVDVNSSKTGEVDTGYLIEAIGNSTKEEEERYFLAETVDGNRLYPTQPEFRFYIKSPDETECTDAQYEYIKNYVTEVNEAIFKKDWKRISSLVDVESAAKMFLVDQIMLNNDMGYCFYLYKKAGDKLYFGPMWDYDQSCGGSSWGGTTYKGWETGTTHTWYTTLIEIPEFKSLVQKIYNEHKTFIRNLPDFVDETVEENEEDFAKNNKRWEELFGDPKKWRRLKELIALTTYEEHVDYLNTWLNNRVDWLEEELKIK